MREQVACTADYANVVMWRATVRQQDLDLEMPRVGDSHVTGVEREEGWRLGRYSLTRR